MSLVNDSAAVLTFTYASGTHTRTFTLNHSQQTQCTHVRKYLLNDNITFINTQRQIQKSKNRQKYFFVIVIEFFLFLILILLYQSLELQSGGKKLGQGHGGYLSPNNTKQRDTEGG